MAPLLELEQLGKRSSSGPDGWLFADLSAVVEEPAIIHILGKSGQGKSTLLRILALLTRPDSGSVRLAGKPPEQWTPERWRMTMSYVAQQPVMLPGSVEDNLQTISRLHQRSFPADQARAWMEQLGLGGLDWSKPADQLSGGEKQRVALVRSLLLRPTVLLLDEVTASLDALSKQATEQLLADLHRREGTTLIWVTHDWEQARSIGQRVWFMADGRLLEDASSDLFFDAPASEEARRFLAAAIQEG
ncbi:putative ABC transport system ATP-binding protein [Brevibacillus aydinogluensis]|jgi:putative ABC transport system ATP-binding protein|uniref:ABC transporter n=1 Tax=Brevibacillus aydinogluensis TaxID=927786 RepID=A0AA48M4N8_9BACL|nr:MULTISPECIES: ATP-binding cassette domain-containing protein [Brevibacillus]MBR8661567.1 ATP-binding cassette domain-containing protein [Brevibacillus sp. NL20B1]MDT3417725.1 putative ABC transport system ATP-binding protein [Brevibacillus aydinogluensis]CAJ1001215.1 ABC transporter [Brevibacillus aydinogluensis]